MFVFFALTQNDPNKKVLKNKKVITEKRVFHLKEGRNDNVQSPKRLNTLCRQPSPPLLQQTHKQTHTCTCTCTCTYLQRPPFWVVKNLFLGFFVRDTKEFFSCCLQPKWSITLKMLKQNKSCFLLEGFHCKVLFFDNLIVTILNIFWIYYDISNINHKFSNLGVNLLIHAYIRKLFQCSPLLDFSMIHRNKMLPKAFGRLIATT